jgi:tetracycline repressor-like protein
MPKPSKRDQLVQATKELLWEAGYEAMSPRDIQARSAAKPGSLYHHFPTNLAKNFGDRWQLTLMLSAIISRDPLLRPNQKEHSGLASIRRTSTAVPSTCHGLRRCP